MARPHTLWSCAALIGLAGFHVTAAAQIPDFGGFAASDRDSKVSVRAEFTPAADDRPALLFITADIAPGFHVSAVDQQQLPDGGGPLPTTFTIPENAEVRLTGPFQPLEPPKVRIDDLVWKGLELREHEDRVTWVAPIEIAPGVDTSKLAIKGLLEGQACDINTVCIPLELEFTASAGKGVPLTPGFTLEMNPTAPAPGDASVEASPPNPPSAATRLNANTTAVSPSAPDGVGEGTRLSTEHSAAESIGPIYDLSRIRLAEASSGSLVYYLLTAFLGGLILNIMPCVLPVIGLKVMSFVQQAGESRRRALVLNVWYSVGIMLVFLALAVLAVWLQTAWGDQFSDARFVVTLAAIVFAMALSMLGVWEIPIPGFVSSSTMMDAAHREGPSAAFLKGVLTTILATPCTGPYMVSGVAWAAKQPAHVTFAVFAAMGVGMASPYLLVGAFPSLIRFLPKPGPWMETFKRAMGLVLLATVVWLLSTIDAALVLPTVALLVGLTAACFWIARTPLTEPRGDRARAWAEAAALTAAAAYLSFGVLYPKVTLPRYQAQLDAYAAKQLAETKMQIAQRLGGVQDGAELERVIADIVASSIIEGDAPWQPFTLSKLGRFTLDERRTVLVDFTASWCASCHFLEQTVLKTDDVTKALADGAVVTMAADYSKKPAWMRETIRALGGIGVPVIAIFPADRPYQPIVFTGGYTQSGLLEAIAKATGRKSQAAPLTASRGGVAAAAER